MAGDWIKMRTDLRTHPKVVRISSALKADTLKTIGGLLSVWSLFDTHSHDGQLEGYTTDLVDELIGWPGFAGQMKAVGWLDLASQDGIQTLAIPRFEVHNGASAKRRAMEADRKRTVRKMSASEADKSQTKSGLEKRREENSNTPLVPQGGDTHASTASGSQSSAETPPPPQAKSEATASPKKKKGGRARLTQPQFPDDLPEAYHAPLTAWFHHKRLTGKGYVETGWTALVTRERTFTPAQVAASVQASMANGYTGLFTADLAAKSTSAPQKKEIGAAVAQPIITPEWDWLAVANTLWPNHNLHRQRWQDLPASTRHDLRQAHQKHLPA